VAYPWQNNPVCASCVVNCKKCCKDLWSLVAKLLVLVSPACRQHLPVQHPLQLGVRGLPPDGPAGKASNAPHWMHYKRHNKFRNILELRDSEVPPRLPPKPHHHPKVSHPQEGLAHARRRLPSGRFFPKTNVEEGRSDQGLHWEADSLVGLRGMRWWSTIHL